jgi:thymidine kinase
MSASIISIDQDNSKCGFLDIIIGPMFSGKTNYLLKELTVFSIMGAKVLYINHSIDNRSDMMFSSHNPLINDGIKETENTSLIKTDNLSEVYDICSNFMVIAIDEAQFFNGLKDFALDLVEKKGKRVIVAGLSGDFNREAFGEIFSLISYCDRITKLSSFCKICAYDKKIKEAHFSHKKQSLKSSIISIGGKEEYIPLCRECYIFFLKFNS